MRTLVSTLVVEPENTYNFEKDGVNLHYLCIQEYVCVLKNAPLLFYIPGILDA